jgi:4-nitrophenyl phosphatase
MTNFDLTQIAALAIDMDGVVWRGNTPLPGFENFFNFLHQQQLPYMLLSNNSTKTPEQYRQKLADMGAAISTERIMTSSLATAAYMGKTFAPGSKIYVVGQDGLRQALLNTGFQLAEDASQPVDAVVSGLDFGLTYDKLKHATLLIRAGAKFICSNADLTLPIEGGFWPGAGSVLAFLEAASGVKATVVGKPGRLMFEVAVEKMGRPRERTAMLGDRLATDILGGQQAGLKTILVTTGVDNAETSAQQGIHPNAIFSGIAELVEVWQAQLSAKI